MNYKVALATGLIIGALGFAFGRYSAPVKTITKTETKTVEVIKEVKVASQQNNRQIHIVTTKYPDGRVVTETFILNKDTIVISDNKESVKENTVVVTKEVYNKKPDYLVGVLVETDYSKPIYGVSIDRRILGPIFLGAYGKTDKQVGLSLKMEL